MLYSDPRLTARFQSDSEYLQRAFECTERLWLKQFDRMSDVKVVMLSEAPLFGSKKAYIYNPASPSTAFFHFNDLRAIMRTNSIPVSFDSVVSQKSFFLDCLVKHSFLILDIFPFALNRENTAINFQKMSSSIYNRLLFESSPFYLNVKLEMIQRKSQSIPRFVYRYKRLFNKTNRFVEERLAALSLIDPGRQLESINGTNMSMDRRSLAQIYSGEGNR